MAESFINVAPDVPGEPLPLSVEPVATRQIGLKHYQEMFIGDLATQLDESASPVTYVGKAPIGSLTSAAVWQIMKIDETSGLAITWANGTNEMNNVWDNRASLSYS